MGFTKGFTESFSGAKWTILRTFQLAFSVAR